VGKMLHTVFPKIKALPEIEVPLEIEAPSRGWFENRSPIEIRSPLRRLVEWRKIYGLFCIFYLDIG
jgi:hypothetical protein